MAVEDFDDETPIADFENDQWPSEPIEVADETPWSAVNEVDSSYESDDFAEPVFEDVLGVDQ